MKPQDETPRIYRDAAKRILAIMLTHDMSVTSKYVRETPVEWFDLALHKKVFSAIKDLHKEGIQSDILSVTKYLRDKNMLEGNMIVNISKITSSHVSIVMIENSLGQLEYEYKHRKVSGFINNMQRKLTNDNFSIDEFLTQYSELNDVLRNQVLEQVSNAETIESILISHDKAKKGEIEGLELGFTNLHKKLLLESVDLMILAARPAMGKTAFAISIMCLLAFEYNIKVAFFSLEMSKTQMMRRIVANLASIDSNLIKYGECSKQQLSLVKSLQMRPEWNNIFLYEGSHTSDDILRISTQLKHDEGIGLIIVDYLQKMTSKKKGQQRYDDVSDHSNDLKFMCQNLQIPCIALSQLSRSVEQRGGDKRPLLSDLKHSGDIEQDATVVSFLYRPEYYGFMQDEHGNSNAGKCQLILAKYREGGLGSFDFNVSLPTSKFTAYEGQTIVTGVGEQNDIPF